MATSWQFQTDPHTGELRSYCAEHDLYFDLRNRPDGTLCGCPICTGVAIPPIVVDATVMKDVIEPLKEKLDERRSTTGLFHYLGTILTRVRYTTPPISKNSYDASRWRHDSSQMCVPCNHCDRRAAALSVYSRQDKRGPSIDLCRRCATAKVQLPCTDCGALVPAAMNVDGAVRCATCQRATDDQERRMQGIVSTCQVCHKEITDPADIESIRKTALCRSCQQDKARHTVNDGPRRKVTLLVEDAQRKRAERINQKPPRR